MSPIPGVTASSTPSESHPIASGVRATSSNVGYFSEYGALTEYTPGGAAPSGWAWDGTSLVSTTGGATLTLAYINGGSVVANDSPGATISKCLIVCGPDDIFGVTLSGSNGTLTVLDTTVVGNLVGTNPQVNGISSDDGLVVRRCHVTRTGDGIHWVGKTGTLISQCYIGSQRFTDEAQHCDGMQHFQDTVDGSTFTVEHCYVASSPSTIGTPMNAALTMGPPSETGNTFTPTINNNYFEAGLYHLRFNHKGRNCVVTNNDFGPIHSGEFDYHEFDTGNGSTYATWSNNRDENGSLIAAP